MPRRPNILYVMAAEQEYGKYLKEMISPLMTGIGPVEAGVAMAGALATARHNGSLPELVVSLGSAGSARLEQMVVYQATSVSYRDMDATLLGFEKGCTPCLDLPANVELAPRIPGLPGASLSTGANIVSGAAYGSIAEDMVDMESFAIMRACQSYDVPLVVIRGISDGVEDIKGMTDWTQYLDIIDHKLAEAVALIEGFMEMRNA